MPKTILYMLKNYNAIKGMRGWISWHHRKYGTYKNIADTTHRLVMVRDEKGNIPPYISDKVKQILRMR